MMKEQRVVNIYTTEYIDGTPGVRIDIDGSWCITCKRATDLLNELRIMFEAWNIPPKLVFRAPEQ